MLCGCCCWCFLSDDLTFHRISTGTQVRAPNFNANKLGMETIISLPGWELRYFNFNSNVCARFGGAIFKSLNSTYMIFAKLMLTYSWIRSRQKGTFLVRIYLEYFNNKCAKLHNCFVLKRMKIISEALFNSLSVNILKFKLIRMIFCVKN